MNMNLENRLKKELPPPKEERDKVKQIAIKALGGFLIIMVALTGLSRSADAITTPQVVAERPKGGRIDQKVEVSGNLKARDEESMEVGEGLLVKNVFVEEGERVQKGDVLLELDAKEIKEKLETAEDDLKKLQLRLEQLGLNKDFTANHSPMETAKKTLTELEKDKIELVKKEGIQVERAKEKVREAEEDLKEAEANFATFQEESLEEQLTKAKEAEKEAQKYLNDQKYEKDKALKRAQQAVDEAKENLWLLGGGEATAALQALERAEMEYEITKSDWERTLKAAEESLQKAKEKMQKLENGEIDDELFKQEEEKVKVARNQVKEQERLLEDTIVSREDAIAELDRKIEDAKKDLVKAESEEENLALNKEQDLQKESIEKELMQLDIEAKKREIARLQKATEEGGQLKAPSAGIIGEVKVKKGDTTTQGDLLVFVRDTSEYILEAHLSKEEAEYIQIGDQVQVTLEGEKTPLENTVVENIVPVQGDTDGKKKVSISVPKGEPGMSATLKVTKESDKYRYILPIEALKEGNGSQYILVAKQQTTTLGEQIIAERVEVMVRDKNQSSVAVEGPLGVEDRVIIRSNKPILAGDRVRLVEQ
ncbi:MAG: HlyD family efflux transporter periplasmic adaptor subunit [Clostridiales bacterium]|jgi:multidrug resistance efflux pump|nr:HlyD family efflux transporter periplasmic adaptor subunit [Clostridiales bacterium]